VIPIGKGDIKRRGTSCTVVAWSKALHTVMEAAKQLANDGIELEVVDPRTLRPLDEELIFRSVKKTNRCVVVQEAHPHSSFGGEVVDRVQRACFDFLDAPIERVAALEIPVPYALNLEALVLPDAARIVAAVKRAMYLS
jgi:pyruvate dehydrogenase E1 component beta subunit